MLNQQKGLNKVKNKASAIFCFTYEILQVLLKNGYS